MRSVPSSRECPDNYADELGGGRNLATYLPKAISNASYISSMHGSMSAAAGGEVHHGAAREKLDGA
ncbi:hypothetical protein E4U09_003910 [Claviceps aff. purpurea]|uniref:Uncharacterized protein n=1 Tax=Claviceps aff. purpurea TaxID=1967640 RepID=A0A9P7U4J2_9HYPO|nr:hypothetical protein E4U09_003910 [Claviceps aff. purpurea]